MALWNKTDANTAAPKFVVNAATGELGAAQYANTVFAVDIAESKVARAGGKGSVSPGWVKVKTVGTRKQYETLVALKITGGDNAANTDLDDATFPDA